MTETNTSVLSSCREIAILDADHAVTLVQHGKTRRIYVKKALSAHSVGVYRCLRGHYIEGIPEVVEVGRVPETGAAGKPAKVGESIKDREYVKDGESPEDGEHVKDRKSVKDGEYAADREYALEEYVSGQVLLDILDNGNCFPVEDAVDITEQLCRILQADLEKVYGSVNNQSLDDIMIANVGEDVAAQQRWMADLANSALDSALPMFMQDALYKASAKAPYSYMSIPQDAKKHLEYIKEAFSNHDPAVEPKASTQKDHIYTLMAWDKLPLYRYGRFEDLRIAYDQDLNKESAVGVHLVRTGAPDADFLSDWSLLPSPKPYFLFSRNSVQTEEEQYAKVHNLVERAIECGMIKVSDERPYVSATVNTIYADGGVALMAAETMLAKKKEIENEKNPATGDSYSTSEIAAKIQQFLDTGKKVLLEENEIKPANVASVLGLEHEPCDPFDPATRADLIKLEKAKENHKRLCVTMTEAMIYTRPDLVRALEMQLPAYEQLSGQIADSAQVEGRWEKRCEYADTAAEIFLFLNDIIFLGGEGYMYKQRGQKYAIVTPSLLSADLKDMDSGLLQALCFLADASEDNAAKADLTRLAAEAKREFNDALNDEQMTADELNEVIEAASDLVKDLKEETETIEHEARVNPGREDELKPQITMAQSVIKALESRQRTYKKIVKGLT